MTLGEALLPLLTRLRGSADVALAVFALGAVTLLVSPAPPWVLDACIALQIAVAAAVLAVAVLARDALGFAGFPTLLLFTTLFRLAIEVSSTRLVLTRGEAGRVIAAFGRIVVGGDYVVGAVVYTLLTLAQLLVVARGAERVAEVAARFTLDALPGKQMSIDADLRAGAIDGAEARRRRRALEREGQLYGAMDGALKFVKGEALAGALIVLVNLAGGLVAGVARGLPLSAAARRYALLAIGDGLVAQLPALLVSVAAGVVVTRVGAEEEGASPGRELGRQLLADPRALGAVAALCAVLAALPGLPAAPFAVLAAGAGAGAAALARRARAAAPSRATAGPRTTPALEPAPLALELAPDLAAAIAGALRAELPALRGEAERELGLPVPEIAVRPAALPPGRWRLLAHGVPAASGSAPLGEALALAPPEELEAAGLAAQAATDPLSGRRAARVPAGDAARAARLAPVRGPPERIGACVARALRANAHLLVGLDQAQAMLEALEATHPALVREVARLVPASTLAEVLRQLAEEGVPLRPLPALLEAVLEAGGGQRSAAELAEAARRGLSRQLAHRLAGDGPLEALLLDPGAETALREALAGSDLALDRSELGALAGSIASAMERRADGGLPVLLAPREVRRALRRLLAPRFPRLAVVSYDELPAEQAVRPVGRVGLEPTLGDHG